MIRKDYSAMEGDVSREAVRHLSKADPVLRPLIRKLGTCKLQPRRDYFNALCEAIINQQLAPPAAASILRKTRSLFPRQRLTPQHFETLSDAPLRSAGVSPQKLRYLRHLCECFLDGTIPVRRLPKLSDDEVMNALTQVLGIGEWTAHVFLIFVLNRPDILAHGDLALKKSVQHAYGLRSMPKQGQLERIAEPWRPFRSYACWYLWMFKDERAKNQR